MDDTAIPRAHGVQRDDGSRLLGLAGETMRKLPQRLLSPLAVALDVERDSEPTVSVVAEDDPAHEVLQRVQGLPAPADDDAAVGSSQGEVNGRALGPGLLHSRSIDQVSQDGLENLVRSSDGLLTGPGGSPLRGRRIGFPGNFCWPIFVGCFERGVQGGPDRRSHTRPTRTDTEEAFCRVLQDLDLDLLPRHPQRIEGALDRLVDARSLRLHRPHFRAPPLSDLSMYHCCPMLRRLFTSQ
jgi:hypothetical protein